RINSLPVEESMSNEYRDLGMRRRIARRDFLNGIALAVGSGVAARTMALDAFGWRAQPQPAGAQPLYPPAATGLRGNYPAAIDALPLPLYRQASQRGSGHCRRAQQRVRSARRISEVESRRGDVLRQGTFRRRSPRRGERAPAVAGIFREGAAV